MPIFKALFIILISFPLSLFSQIKDFGSPNIRNYPRSINNGGIQNWAISQDQNGFMYFANNDGLLCFDGVKWNLIPVSSCSPLRSVFVDSKNTIYVGLINDFGIINRENSNASVFKSLKNLLPDGFEEFEDVWRIHEIDDGIVFQCFKYLFLLKNNKLTVIKPKKSFHFSFQLGNRLFLQEQGIGVFELIDGELSKLSYWEEHKDKEISAILETGNNQILIGTMYDGIFVLENEKLRKWDTPVNDFLIKNRLFCASRLPGNYFAFGTILNGLVIADMEGNIVQTLNRDNGIQNNTVLSVYVDRADDLWLGLDNGIDYIETNSPLSYIGSNKLGAGYCCKVFKGNLYLGTNQGLYVQPFNGYSNNKNFKLVNNTDGQVWSLDEFDGELICGHNLGTFKVSGHTALKISNEEGAWKYIALKDNPELLLGGHYEGLVLLKKENNKWTFSKKIKGFEESSRYIVQDEDGDIWIGHGGRGLFRVRLNEDLDGVKEVVHYTVEHGLPSKLNNILFKYKKSIYVSTNKGVFQYNKTSGSFNPSKKLNNLFSNCGKVKTVVTEGAGDVWYIADEESGVMRQNEDMTFTRIEVPFKKLNNKYVNEFEFIYPYDNENVFIGVEDGFAHYSSVIPKSYKQSYKSFISKIELPYIDSTLSVQTLNLNSTYKFPFEKNSFRFHFTAPFFENETPLHFSYFLEGFSEKWSGWSNDNYKDFTTLNEGKYQLKLKAKNIYGVESESASFTFEISPPWHRSNQAYLVYILLLLLMVFLLTKYILYRIKQLKLREEQKHLQDIRKQEEHLQNETLIADKENIKLRNERLHAEMVCRDKELANQTMGIIQKSKFLKKVDDDLNSIQDFIVNDTAKTKICSLKKRIKKEINIKEQNKIFETYFDEVHEEFGKKLNEKYPVLSANDLRICAFIRMNLTTQEIATILNITYRGAEVIRYRLRKKLELDRSINLATFLTNI